MRNLVFKLKTIIKKIAIKVINEMIEDNLIVLVSIVCPTLGLVLDICDKINDLVELIEFIKDLRNVWVLGMFYKEEV